MEDNKNTYALLQKIRNELSNANLSKSGKNAHLGFEYFELKDFVPTATKLFNNYGLTPIFNIEIGADGVEYAILDIHNASMPNDRIRFKTPTAEPNGNNPIQSLGAKITYMRRYLYLIALDIVENDIVDASDPNEVKKSAVKYATPVQVETIFKYGKLLSEELASLNIKSKNDVKSLTLEKATELCKLINERNGKEDA